MSRRRENPEQTPMFDWTERFRPDSLFDEIEQISYYYLRKALPTSRIRTLLQAIRGVGRPNRALSSLAHCQAHASIWPNPLPPAHRPENSRS